jgi:outer membrane receptor for ferrienterochelin and colicin
MKGIGMKFLLSVCVAFLAPSLLRCDEPCTLQGTVRDGSTNEPLAFATIVVEGAQQGTTTDTEGEFTLPLLQGSYRLRCSYVGYKTEVIPVSVPREAPCTIVLTAIDVLMQDVTVYAHRFDEANQAEASVLSLQSEKMTEVTSVIPDVLRSIQMLPGVSANNEFSAKFNVRGGNQDENLVLVDGTQVYDPFHVKEASNASIGIFNVDMIRKMDLITGGFTARYGDKMSSVLNIEYREGSREQVKGITSLSMTNVEAVVEGPLGENGSFILGGRKSYFEYVLKMLDMGPYIHPSFYDIQGVLGYSLGARQKLLLKFIHSGDDFREDPHRNVQNPFEWTATYGGTLFTNTQQISDSITSRADYYSSMVALQSVTTISSAALIQSEVSLYDQREAENSWNDSRYAYRGVSSLATYFYNNNYEHSYANDLRIRTVEVNSTLDMQLHPSYGIKTGLSYQHINYDQDRLSESVVEEFTNERQYPDTTYSRRIDNAADNMGNRISAHSYKVAGYLENVFQLGTHILLNLGGRFDYFDLNKDLTWSPRVNVAYRTARGLVFRGAWGHYYQSPIYRQIAYPIASDTNTQSQRAIHYILGADYDLIINQANRQFVKIKLEGFRKTYDNLITATQSSDGSVYYSKNNDATGTASGVDLYVAYAYPGFYGWMSYSYLKASQTLLRDTIGSSFPRNTDQRHTLALAGEMELGSGWKVNSRFVYGSGYAYTPSHTVYNQQQGYWEWIPGLPNSDHLPAYKRTDLRISKSFLLFGKSTSVFLDVSNLFNATNIQAYRYRFDNGGNPYREEIKLWPILPTLGISMKF